MIGDLIAGLIGKSIDASDGDAGNVGAAEGVVVYEVAKRVIPLALVAGGIWFGARYVRSKLKGDAPAA